MDVMMHPTPDPTPKRTPSSDDVTRKRNQYQNLPSVQMEPATKKNKVEDSSGASTKAPSTTKGSGGDGDQGDASDVAVANVENVAPTKRFRSKKPSSFALVSNDGSAPPNDSKDEHPKVEKVLC